MEFLWTEDISSEVYKDAIHIRKEVFVKEQHIEPELEIDDLEDQTFHLVGYINSVPSATARIYEKAPHIFKIQRVAVIRDARKTGSGKKLMEELEQYIRSKDAEIMILDSQDQAIPFYEKSGFSVEGEGFMDAGIPHHRMVKKI
ncbi:GNAT family N-acetyltransferase [Marinilactibacillus sp. 15R]|uniref:GNAT family N-acetyltransferase n=1 Tax=Marinilactibacillus sp. 15R TaxID=1911586 RepID=UPI00090B9D35|nr:GNAT family N-acetyltransferase [Marinilactibacillus sp. 15R]API89125.1 GNAT family N-acetyltransferase [Marinilactibacillus sp. 15R]